MRLSRADPDLGEDRASRLLREDDGDLLAGHPLRILDSLHQLGFHKTTG